MAAMAAGLPLGVYSVWIINKSGGLIFQRVREPHTRDPSS